MKPVKNRPTREFGVRCAVCATHTRPLYVPWHQHAVGCSVRAADLERRQLALSASASAVSSLVTF
jgi:hypothetical protein